MGMFDFNVSKGGYTYEDVQKRKALAEALGGGVGSPRTFGEGLSALGSGIGAALAGRRASKAEEQRAALGNAAFEEALGGVPDNRAALSAALGGQGVASAAVYQPSGNQLRDGIIETANAIGADPLDLATTISYETGGTFDPTKAGPTTQWGQHRGLIQFGQPQAKQYGADFSTPETAMSSQLGADGAIANYFRSSGFKPGMSGMDLYSTVNAGAPGRYGASDENNGGAPGTVADKWNQQMSGHREKAAQLLGGDYSPPAASAAPVVQQPAFNVALIRAMQNPYMTPEQKQILGGIYQQQQAAQNAAYEMQLKQSDPMYQAQLQQAQFELERARNPAPRDLINAGGGKIYDPNSGQWIVAPGGQQEVFRQATSEEAAGYGAAAGQFGPDGRFYPVNPPSGFSFETGPDGQMRVTQGPGANGAAGKPFTEGQSKDVVYATRAEGALNAFEPYADALTSYGDSALGGLPLGLSSLTRGLQSDEYQKAEQAGREFLQAILRKDTGAAITKEEEASYGAVYLPRPGDSAELLGYKKVARQRALAALKSGMGADQILAQERALGVQGAPAAAAPAGGWNDAGNGVKIRVKQ